MYNELSVYCGWVIFLGGDYIEMGLVVIMVVSFFGKVLIFLLMLSK